MANKKSTTQTSETLLKQRQKLLSDLNKLNGEIHKASSAENPKPSADELKTARRVERKKKYITENGLTIHKLRKAGHTVSVSHIRNYEKTVKTCKGEHKILVPVNASLRGALGENFHPKGGQTWIHITTVDKEQIIVDATCVPEDHYDYKLGVKLCLDSISKKQADELLSTLELVEAAQA